MGRFLRRAALALFALRSFANLVLFISLLHLLAAAHGDGDVSSLVVFAAVLATLAMAPVIVATAAASAQLLARSEHWPRTAMGVVAGGLLVDLFFLGNAESWWLGVAIVAFDLGLCALLAAVAEQAPAPLPSHQLGASSRRG